MKICQVPILLMNCARGKQFFILLREFIICRSAFAIKKSKKSLAKCKKTLDKMQFVMYNN